MFISSHNLHREENSMNESVSMIKKKKPKKTADVHVYVHSLKILYDKILDVNESLF